MLASSGLTLNDCTQNSVQTTWYVDLKVDGEQVILESFYDGYGYTDVPINTLWRNTLITYLPNLYNYGLNFILDGNLLTINSLTYSSQYFDKMVSLNVGIDISINCDSN